VEVGDGVGNGVEDGLVVVKMPLHFPFRHVVAAVVKQCI